MKIHCKTILITATLALCGNATISCKGNNEAAKPQAENIDAEADAETYVTAIERYLTEEIAPNYAKGEVSIPSCTIVSTEESDSNNIKVWGDFWVFNYNLSGDTLKTVSGGSHPGLMHIRKAANHFEVMAFDAVEDGSSYLPSAKRIFGDKFDAWQKISSDEKKREEVRAQFISKYVKAHHIPATMYQDYGWEAVKF